MKKRKLKLFLIFVTILLCYFFSTIAYSALYTTLEVSGVAYSRPVKDVRITGFRIFNSVTATSSFEEFGVNIISTKFNLSNSSSSIIFDVEVTNYGSSDVGILQLNGTVPTGLSYELINYDLKDKLCDDTGKCNVMAVKNFQIKFTGDPGEYDVNLELDFRTFHKVTYNGITNNSYPTEVIDGGELNVTFEENLKRVLVLSNDLEINYYDEISNGQNIIIENVSSNIVFKLKESAVKLINGEIDEVGSEVCIKEECFYIIDNDGSIVTMLAKYNLHVGNIATNAVSSTNYNSGDYKVSNLANVNNSAYVLPLAPPNGFTATITPLESPTGIQNVDAKGMDAEFPYIGVEKFSTNNYWYISQGSSMPKLNPNYGSSYPAYVYDSNSLLYNYIENYKNYLTGFDVNIFDARLIKSEEVENLGCNMSSCDDAPEWLYSTSYWTGSLSGVMYFYAIRYYGILYPDESSNSYDYGVRPVIEIPISEF